MLNDDIVIAQKILSGSYNNIRNITYHKDSFIYKNTNEKISCYKKHLENRKKILSVIASGDQILNSILLGSTNIDAYDISRFPKYFLELKIAAIKTLSKEEYIKFFMGKENKDEFNDDVYDLIRKNIRDKSLGFWDSLFNFFDGCEIYHSSLFSNEVYNIENIVKNNLYLQSNNYDILKEKLNYIKIKYYTSSIFELIKCLSDSYDLINLSSIIYHSRFENFKNYIPFLEKLNLNQNGISLTYLYDINENIYNTFREDGFEIDSFENSGNGVLIYKR